MFRIRVVVGQVLEELFHVLMRVLVTLRRAIPRLAEEHVLLVGAVDEVVRVGPAPAGTYERKHGALHRERKCDCRVRALLPHLVVEFLGGGSVVLLQVGVKLDERDESSAHPLAVAEIRHLGYGFHLRLARKRGGMVREMWFEMRDQAPTGQSMVILT